MQAEFEKRANPNDRGQQALLEEMRAHVKKVCTIVDHSNKKAGTLHMIQYEMRSPGHFAVGGDAEK